MNIVNEIVNFFSRFFRQKVNSAQSQARAKVMNAEYRAKAKASGAMNKKIDEQVKKAKGTAQKPRS